MNQENPPQGVLPDELKDWVESAAGGRLISVQSRAGGGVSRQGAELLIDTGGGEPLRCYLSYDVRRRDDETRQAFSRREASALKALQGTSIKVPQLIGASDEYLALLTGWAEGETHFSALRDEDRKRRLAFDYLDQLAQIHAVDINALELPGFPPVAPVADYVRPAVDDLIARHEELTPDPILVYALRWLRNNIPAYDGPTVLVHGDAGPANFLYQGDKVTAVLDWEMTHFGDPMEDFAWISIRDLFQPFIPLRECLAEYGRLSGIPADASRIRYYRIYNLAGMLVGNHRNLKQTDSPISGVIGIMLGVYELHLRVLVEGLADAMGIATDPPALPDLPPAPEERYYDAAMADLRERIIPQLTDQAASQNARSQVRLLMYFKAKERYGRTFDDAELAELRQALDPTIGSVAEGRARLCEAIRAVALDDETLLRLFVNRVTRQTRVMADAMGSLATRHFSPLD